MKYCDFNSNVLFTKKMLYSLKRSLDHYEYWYNLDDNEDMLETIKEEISNHYRVLKQLVDKIGSEI